MYQIIIKSVFACFQNEYRLDESPVSRDYILTVTRGLDVDGVTHIGPADDIVTVPYQLLPNTASLGSDFTGVNGASAGQVVFPVGVRTSSVSVQIIDDKLPELEEFFRVKLK